MTNPYPHLHITENMVDAIKMIPSETWKKFFLSVEISKLATVKSCPDSDLTTERGKLTMIDELQGIFLAIANHKQKETNK